MIVSYDKWHAYALNGMFKIWRNVSLTSYVNVCIVGVSLATFLQVKLYDGSSISHTSSEEGDINDVNLYMFTGYFWLILHFSVPWTSLYFHPLHSPFCLLNTYTHKNALSVRSVRPCLHQRDINFSLQSKYLRLNVLTRRPRVILCWLYLLWNLLEAWR